MADAPWGESDVQIEEQQPFQAAYVVIDYAKPAERDEALERVGQGSVGNRVRAAAILQEVDPRRMPERLVAGEGDRVLFALEAPDEPAMQRMSASLTAGSGVIHAPSSTCSCLICRGLQITDDGVTPSYIPPDRWLVFLQLRIDRGVRWPQLRTTTVASAACTDGTMVLELTGPDLDVLGVDAERLMAAPGVLGGRVLAGVGSDLRQS